ncbi:MAG: hypothetical protein R3Y62_02970 [Eubacteriales bacterium]
MPMTKILIAAGCLVAVIALVVVGFLVFGGSSDPMLILKDEDNTYFLQTQLKEDAEAFELHDDGKDEDSTFSITENNVAYLFIKDYSSDRLKIDFCSYDLNEKEPTLVEIEDFKSDNFSASTAIYTDIFGNADDVLINVAGELLHYSAKTQTLTDIEDDVVQVVRRDDSVFFTTQKEDETTYALHYMDSKLNTTEVEDDIMDIFFTEYNDEDNSAPQIYYHIYKEMMSYDVKTQVSTSLYDIESDVRPNTSSSSEVAVDEEPKAGERIDESATVLSGHLYRVSYLEYVSLQQLLKYDTQEDDENVAALRELDTTFTVRYYDWYVDGELVVEQATDYSSLGNNFYSIETDTLKAGSYSVTDLANQMAESRYASAISVFSDALDEGGYFKENEDLLILSADLLEPQLMEDVFSDWDDANTYVQFTANLDNDYYVKLVNEDDILLLKTTLTDGVLSNAEELYVADNDASEENNFTVAINYENSTVYVQIVEDGDASLYTMQKGELTLLINKFDDIDLICIYEDGTTSYLGDYEWMDGFSIRSAYQLSDGKLVRQFKDFTQLVYLGKDRYLVLEELDTDSSGNLEGADLELVNGDKSTSIAEEIIYFYATESEPIQTILYF